MADSTTNMDLIIVGQSQKEVLVNQFMNAASPAAMLAMRWNGTAGLNWFYYGGVQYANGVAVPVANGSLGLTASSTNYVEVDQTGAVSVNTTGFTPGRIPLYTVETGSTTPSSYTDYRSMGERRGGKAAIAITADYTLTAFDCFAKILEFSGAPSAAFNVLVPSVAFDWIVHNGTGEALTILVSGQTGVVIGAGKRAVVYCDGVDVQRASADV